MSRWTTQQRLEEVVRRTATDGAGLDLLEKKLLRTRLAESDRKFGDGTQADFAPSLERAGGRGTMEMGLADRAA